MNKGSKIYIAGHRGMVGSAILKNLQEKGFKNIITKSHDELDLTNQEATQLFFNNELPEIVFLAAARVGGIHANNTYRAEFIYANLMIQNNIIHAAHLNKVKKLLFLGSSCIYPKLAPQPMKEEYLMSGELEPTNEPYAIAKIAGIKMCESYFRQYGNNFISVMPTNLYGPNDNFDLENSHVLPALIHKIHNAKINLSENVEIWGSGKPKREFLYVDDLADACVHLMQSLSAIKLYNSLGLSHINIGTGIDVTIAELANKIAKVVGFKGKFTFNNEMPDGTPRKLLDVSRINKLGWESKINLIHGLEKTYKYFCEYN